MTRDELLDDLQGVREDVARYFASLPLEELYRSDGTSWAPVDDLRHLTRSVTLVTRGFGLPAEALRARFGAPAGPTRSRAEVGALALAGLAAGGKASPELIPDPVPESDRTDAFRAFCLDAWRAASLAFEEILAAWPEEELDRCQLPHPFLGMFSLREWVHFNVLHARHHVRVAERKLGRG